MEKTGYFKYLLFFLVKSLESGENLRRIKSSRSFSSTSPTGSARGADSSIANTGKHEDSNSRDSIHQLTSKFKDCLVYNSNDESYDYIRLNTSSWNKPYPRLSTSQSQSVSRDDSHSGAKKQPNSFDIRDLIPNTSQGLIQNNDDFCYAFDSLGVKENLKKLFSSSQPESIMNYVKILQSNPDENADFMSAKILPNFEYYFYPLIYNFFLNEISDNPNPNSREISGIADQIVEQISEVYKELIFTCFFSIISQLLNLNFECQEIIINNRDKIISKLSEAYILNLFYYILDYEHYVNYLFGKREFGLGYMSFECMIISQSYFNRTEAKRVKELFTLFLSTIKKRMESAISNVLKYLESECYKKEKVGANKLNNILAILVRSNIENISFPEEFHRVHPEYALEEKNYLSNETSSSEFEPSNFIGIFSQTQWVFLLTKKNDEYYLDRLYQSYLVFLIYAHNNEKSKNLKRIISELEKYLDCFPQLLLKLKNIAIFKYLFGFYEKELNIKFISVFVKIIGSVVYHIKYSKIDFHRKYPHTRYLEVSARNALRFMNKLGKQLQNKFAKEKSNYDTFWEAYNEAFSEQTMKFLYSKARFTRDETFKFLEIRANEALYSMPQIVQIVDSDFVMPKDCTTPIPIISSNNVSFYDILDEFWYHFETENYSFDKNGNLIFPPKSSNRRVNSSLLKRSHDGKVDSGPSSKIKKHINN